MMDNNYLVILAGAKGSRFWPISSEEKPKQFLDILNCGRTLLQLTADRFRQLVPDRNVWVVTIADYAGIVREQLPEIPESNILVEPCQKGTAPAICYVSWKIKKQNARANVIVTPSDHIVPNAAPFLEAAENALSFAAETDAIVTLGLKPTRPETGYGYIKADLSFSSSRKHNIYRVDAFKEKPSAENAAEYVKLPNYFWNSGLFIWNVCTIVNAYRVYEPEISAVFENLLPIYDTPEEASAIEHAFEGLQKTSVDYAIMEKAEEIFVYLSNFPWSDLNSWGTLRQLHEKDCYGNAVIGCDVTIHESFNCLVHATSARRMVIQGLDGYVVAEHDGRILICKLSEEERIKLFLKEEGKGQ